MNRETRILDSMNLSAIDFDQTAPLNQTTDT